MDVANVTQVGQRPSRVEQDLRRLKDVTGKIVGSVFYGTMLKAMRESTLNGPYGHGGRGEEAFAPQLHGILAERMGSQPTGGLSDALYARLERQQTLISEQLAFSGRVPA